MSGKSVKPKRRCVLVVDIDGDRVAKIQEIIRSIEVIMTNENINLTVQWVPTIQDAQEAFAKNRPWGVAIYSAILAEDISAVELVEFFKNFFEDTGPGPIIAYSEQEGLNKALESAGATNITVDTEFVAILLHNWATFT